MILSNGYKFLKYLWLSGILFIVAQAQASTICTFDGCNQPTVEYRNYQYAGYLTDLTVSSTQALPVSLTQLYDLLNVTPGTSVPVSASISVKESSRGFGVITHAYGYSVSFGGLTIGGSVNDPGSLNSPDSSFANDVSAYGGVADQVKIIRTSYTVNSIDPLLAIQSRNAYAPDFVFTLTDPSALSIDSTFPAANNALETLFPSGSFLLRGGLQLKDANGLLVPFDAANSIALSGSLSTMMSTFDPMQTAIDVSSCGLASGTLCVPSVVIVPTVPLPNTAIVFASSLLGLGTLCRRKFTARLILAMAA